MREETVSFAAVFTKDGSSDPLCSMCFLVKLHNQKDPDSASDYLVQRVIPQIARKIPNSDPDTVCFAMKNCLDEMERELGVCCQGFLTDYNLSIYKKS